jgi:hypothetical protein
MMLLEELRKTKATSRKQHYSPICELRRAVSIAGAVAQPVVTRGCVDQREGVRGYRA